RRSGRSPASGASPPRWPPSAPRAGPARPGTPPPSPSHPRLSCVDRHATSRVPASPGSVTSANPRWSGDGRGRRHTMRQDAWRSYLEMALGLTEASRKQATKAVKRAIGKGGATTQQLQGLAEELVRTSAANREAITKLVRAE